MAAEIPRPEHKNVKLDMENLRALWSFATSQRERAEIEVRMWDLAPKEERKGGCAKWLARIIPTPLRPAEARNSLRQIGKVADVLWERVDGAERMLLETASNVLTRARVRAVAEHVALAEALSRELTQYDSWNLYTTKDGTFRKPAQRAKGFGRKGRMRVRPSGSARDLWSAVRAALKRVVDAELGDMTDAHTRELLRSQMETELSGMFDLLHVRMQTAKRHAVSDSARPVNVDAARKDLRDACILLSIDPPSAGKFVKHVDYVVAKKNYKRLVLEYRPSLDGISHDDPNYQTVMTRYDNVVKAMQIVEASYQAADKTTPPSSTTESDHGERYDSDK